MGDDIADRVQSLLTELFPSGIPLGSYRALTHHLPSLQALVELSLSCDKFPPSSRYQLRVLPVMKRLPLSSPLKHEFVELMQPPLTAL